MMVIVGLGNPGEDYALTYHNAGRLFAEHCATAYHAELKTVSRKHFEYAKIPGGVIVVPLTFMNLSGMAVRETLDFFDAATEELVVAHDDSDLLLGTYKYTLGGGSAGHHGIESIMKNLGTAAFWRLRFGIRHPQETERKKAGEFVLGTIGAHERETLYGVFDAAIRKLTENVTP